MIFLLGEESQVSLEQFEILRGVSKKTPRFEFTYNYFVYYSYAKTLFAMCCCVKISATTTAHNVYRNNYLQKIFFLYLNDFIFDI